MTGHAGPDTADFVGTAMTARKLGATLTLDVRRVHPTPGRVRLVWMAISFMTTERPWGTDGGTVAAYKKKDGRLKELGRTVVTRGAAFVRLPWKKAPVGRTSVMVCYLGSDVVEESCSPYAVVRRGALAGLAEPARRRRHERVPVQRARAVRDHGEQWGDPLQVVEVAPLRQPGLGGPGADDQAADGEARGRGARRPSARCG